MGDAKRHPQRLCGWARCACGKLPALAGGGYGDQFKEILDEQTALKELRATILAENKEHAEADRRIRDAAGMLENAVPHIAEWDETAIRQLVAQVKVLSKNEISVTLKSGIEIRQSISN